MQKVKTDCYYQIKLQDVNPYFKKKRSSVFTQDVRIRILGKLEKISPKSTIQTHIQNYLQKKIDKEELFSGMTKDPQAGNEFSRVGGSESFKYDEVYGILSEEPYFVIINFNDIVSRLSLIPGEYYFVFGDLVQWKIEAKSVLVLNATICFSARGINTDLYDKILEEMEKLSKNVGS